MEKSKKIEEKSNKKLTPESTILLTIFFVGLFAVIGFVIYFMLIK